MTEKELRQKFVNMAVSYVGVKEGSSKHKYIVNTYNKIKPLPSGYKVKYTDAWCATFVSFCAAEAGLLDYIPAECSCNRMIALAKKMGIWFEKDNYVPNTGDILMYDWEDNGIGDNVGVSDHVGIVIAVTGGTIKVIEGNYHDAVGYRNIPVNGRYIRGFIVPKFSSKSNKKESLSSLISSIGIGKSSKGDVCNVELKKLRQGDMGASVMSLQFMLIGYGFPCGKSGADGDFGKETLSAVKKYQMNKGLSPDGVVGEKTWAKLLLG